MKYRYDLAINDGTNFTTVSEYSDGDISEQQAILDSITWTKSQIGTGGPYEGYSVGRLDVSPFIISITELP